jgi:hypothetical protein
MRNRRFLLLAATLVTLNTALWLAPQGLALRQLVAVNLFGKSMMRADVVRNDGTEWRVDRGIVVSNTPATSGSPATLTLQEADTKIQAITVSPSATRVTFAGLAVKLRAIRPGWHVLVTWPAPPSTSPAVSVVIEKKHL